MHEMTPLSTPVDESTPPKKLCGELTIWPTDADDLVVLVLTRAEALTRGVTDNDLRSPRWVKLLHGLYAPTPQPLTLEARVRGGLHILPSGSYATGHTALRLHGFKPSRGYPLTMASSARARRRGMIMAPLDPDAEVRDGIASVATAWRHISTTDNIVEATAIAEALLHARTCTLDDIMRNCMSDRVASLIRTGAESLPETRVRLMMVLCHLPEPEIQVNIGNDDFIGRVDMLLRPWGTVIEYEGQQHRTESVQWTRDIRRYESMASDGWVVLRITKDDMRAPQDLMWRIHDSLRLRGYNDGPPRFTAEWLSLFQPTAVNQRVAPNSRGERTASRH